MMAVIPKINASYPGILDFCLLKSIADFPFNNFMLIQLCMFCRSICLQNLKNIEAKHSRILGLIDITGV